MRLIVSISALILLTIESFSQDRHNQERFLVAHDLISQGHFETALDSLKLNIMETPEAIDIDYDYGWATVCLAKLCRIDEFFHFYKIMRTQFNGLQHLGSAIRDWDDRLSESKRTILACPGVDQRIVQQLEELDIKSKLVRDSHLEQLIRDAAMGNSSALQELELHGADLAKLIAEGRLLLTGSTDSSSDDIALIHKKGDNSELYLPPRMRSALSDFDPDFSIWGLSDYHSLLRSWYPYSDKNLPFVVLGDFNGDGKQDAVLHGHNRSADMVVCLLSLPDSFQGVIVERWGVDNWAHSSHSENYLAHVGPRLIRSNFEDEQLDLKTDAFIIGDFEKAATLYYFKDGRFHQYTTAD